MVLTLPSVPAVSYDQFWAELLPGETNTVIELKSTTAAYVILTESLSYYDYAYKVIIGDNSNQMSHIQRRNQSHEMVSVSTPNILKGDQSQYFWISWKDAHLQVSIQAKDT